MATSGPGLGGRCLLPAPTFRLGCQRGLSGRSPMLRSSPSQRLGHWLAATALLAACGDDGAAGSDTSAPDTGDTGDSADNGDGAGGLGIDYGAGGVAVRYEPGVAEFTATPWPTDRLRS